MRNKFKLLRKVCLILFLSLGVMITLGTARAQAAVTGAAVSITFDDGVLSPYTNGLPILKDANMKAAVFIPTKYVGQTDHMTWAQIKALQNMYGWEVGSHTVNHSELPLLTRAQIRNQLINSKDILVSKGLKVTSFASPYGAYDNRVLIEADKIYNLHRGFWDNEELNQYPYNRSAISVKSVESTTTVDQVKAWIDQAMTEKKWLVLVFHEIQPSLNPDYGYTTTINDFKSIVEYISSSGISVVLPNNTLQKPGTNLITNYTFASGVSKGWTTDDSTKVLVDTNDNGSYPSSTKSVVFKGSTKASHLFSNSIPNSSSKYSFEVFVNANPLSAGEVGFYVDEYDSSGQWVSGQWLGAIYSSTVTHFATTYTPTSTDVSTFKMQTYITPDSIGKAYLDNYQIYGL